MQDVDFLILTAVPREGRAVDQVFDLHPLPGQGLAAPVSRGLVVVEGRQYSITHVCVTVSHNIRFGPVAAIAIQKFKPHYVVMLGINASLQDNNLTISPLDAIVVTTVSSLNRRRIENGTETTELESWSCETPLLKKARMLWEDKDPSVKFGQSVDAGILVKDASRRAQIAGRCPNAIALEMEGAGLAIAIQETNSPGVDCLPFILKCVVDFADREKSDVHQEEGAMRAAMLFKQLIEASELESLPDLQHAERLANYTTYREKLYAEFINAILTSTPIDDKYPIVATLKAKLKAAPSHSPSDFVRDTQLYEKLGEGGFSEVWKGRNRRDASWEAIKILHHFLLNDEASVKLFLRGADSWRQLSDAGLSVPQFLGIVHEANCLAIRCRYIQATPLDHWVGDRTAAEDRMVVFRRLLEIVRDAHSLGICHGDLTPANVLVGADLHVWLTDFDLSHGDTLRIIEPTLRSISKFGTIGVLPPEAFDRSLPSHSTVAWDVFGVGRMLEFVLTGAVRFWTPDRDSLRNYDRLVDEGRHRWQARIIANCCAYLPENRYQNVAQILTDLDTCTANPLYLPPLTDKGAQTRDQERVFDSFRRSSSFGMLFTGFAFVMSWIVVALYAIGEGGLTSKITEIALCLSIGGGMAFITIWQGIPDMEYLLAAGARIYRRELYGNWTTHVIIINAYLAFAILPAVFGLDVIQSFASLFAAIAALGAVGWFFIGRRFHRPDAYYVPDSLSARASQQYYCESHVAKQALLAVACLASAILARTENPPRYALIGLIVCGCIVSELLIWRWRVRRNLRCRPEDISFPSR